MIAANAAMTRRGGFSDDSGWEMWQDVSKMKWLVLKLLLIIPWLVFTAHPVKAADFVSGELLITYKEGMEPELSTAGQSKQKFEEITSRHRLQNSRRLTTPNRASILNRVDRLKFPQGAPLTLIKQELESLEHIEAVEYNYLVRFKRTPNDEYFPYQWGPVKVMLPQAWDIVTGYDQSVVAIIDSGVNYNHPDMPFSRIIKGPDYVNGDNDPMDDNGHGTMVAGVLMASTNNFTGMAGSMWQGRLMAIKVLDNQGFGEYTDMLMAVQYAIDNGAGVINISLGVPVNCSQATTLQSLINTAANAKIPVVAAAGNLDYDASAETPASCNQVITVGATDYYDARASYSNFGSVVDLAAPGGDGDDADKWILTLTLGSDYVMAGGTSFAAPLVSGAAAIIRGLNPNLGVKELRDLLVATGDPIATDKPVGPRLNTYKAVEAVAVAPTQAVLEFDLDGDGDTDFSDLILWLRDIVDSNIFAFNRLVAVFGK